MNMTEKLFELYMAEARDSFVKDIQQQEWNTELRTSAENILIAYDQMRERLLTPREEWISVTSGEYEFPFNEFEYFLRGDKLVVKRIENKCDHKYAHKIENTNISRCDICGELLTIKEECVCKTEEERWSCRNKCENKPKFVRSSPPQEPNK